MLKFNAFFEKSRKEQLNPQSISMLQSLLSNLSHGTPSKNGTDGGKSKSSGDGKNTEAEKQTQSYNEEEKQYEQPYEEGRYESQQYRQTATDGTKRDTDNRRTGINNAPPKQAPAPEEQLYEAKGFSVYERLIERHERMKKNRGT